MTDTTAVRAYLLGLQGRIVETMQAADGKSFLSDAWQRPAGGRLEGDGLSQLVEEGGLLERGGCNFSHVKGAFPAARLPKVDLSALQLRKTRRPARTQEVTP
jgi:coproporphyrinogen III oxidase